MEAWAERVGFCLASPRNPINGSRNSALDTGGDNSEEASVRSSELKLKGALDRPRSANLIERTEICIIAARQTARLCLRRLAKQRAS
jgi:hypothetical protein